MLATVATRATSAPALPKAMHAPSTATSTRTPVSRRGFRPRMRSVRQRTPKNTYPVAARAAPSGHPRVDVATAATAVSPKATSVTNGARRCIATTEPAAPGLMAGRTVAVAGGGVGGLAVALAFARRGARVTLFEQASALRETGAGLQITPNGGVVLAALGLDSAVAQAGIAAAALQPMDGLSGQPVARFALDTLPWTPACVGTASPAPTHSAASPMGLVGF